MLKDARLCLVSVIALLVVVAAALLTGCDFPSPQATAVPDMSTEIPPPSQPTVAPTDALLPASDIITLTIWTTESFSPTQAITSGQILAQQAAAFEAAQPDVRLQFVVKKPYGEGGILDYLLNTQTVVPKLLPDLVVIDVEELSMAVEAELLQPLDDLLPTDLVADLYPSARDAATLDGRLYGLQHRADLDHLVYNTAKVTIPPSSWPGVLSNPGPHTFPAAGHGGLVNDAFLIQYLAVRPWPSEIRPEDPFLEADSLTAVLQYYQDGVSRGIFPAEILDYHTTDDAWRDYLAGQAALTQVSAHRYLSERDRSPSSVAAAIPAINGPAAAIDRGWALALVTSDPIRQSATVEFMAQLMAPEANAAWNEAAGYLPTRRSALAHWHVGDGYSSLIHQQLLTARPRPAIPNYARTAAALQQAVEAVVTGNATPEEAAAQAIEGSQ